MSDLDMHFSPRRDEDVLSGLRLRRETSSESLKLLLRASTAMRHRKNGYSRKAIKWSKKIFRLEPSRVKDERKEVQKLFLERNYWLKQQMCASQEQGSAEPLLTPSDPGPSSHSHSHHNANLPKSSLQRSGKRKRGLAMLTHPVHLICDYSKNDFGDMPPPKSDSWFRDEELPDDSITSASGSTGLTVSCPDTQPPLGREGSSFPCQLVSPASLSTSTLMRAITSRGIADANMLFAQLPVLSPIGQSHRNSGSNSPRSLEENQLVDVFKVASDPGERWTPGGPPELSPGGKSQKTRILTQVPEPSERSYPACDSASLASSSALASRSISASLNYHKPNRRPQGILYSSPIVSLLSQHYKQDIISHIYGKAPRDASSCSMGIPRAPPPLPLSNSSATPDTTSSFPTNTSAASCAGSISRPRKPGDSINHLAERGRFLSDPPLQAQLAHPFLPEQHPSSKPLSSPATRSGLSYETDVLIEQQGGVSFFGRENFNQRFRSKPWQTIKNVRRYDRPGKWDAQYLDDAGISKLVQTPLTLDTFLLPSPEWSWVNDFTIDRKSRPVDSQGWEYYDIFSRKWQSRRNGLKTFVRRRKWVRTRVKNIPLRQLPQVDGESGRGMTVGHNNGDGSLRDDDDVRRQTTDFTCVVELTKAGPQQFLVIKPQTHRFDTNVGSLARIPPFHLYCDNCNLDCRDPFFSVRDLLPLLLDHRHQIARSFAAEPSARSDEQVQDVPEFLEQCHKALIQLNMKRAAKILRDLSEHGKLRLWRYWLGLDTYTNLNQLQAMPNVEDAWWLTIEHLDDILDLFTFQSSKFKFLYLVNRLHTQLQKKARRSKSTPNTAPERPGAMVSLSPVGPPSDTTSVFTTVEALPEAAQATADEQRSLSNSLRSEDDNFKAIGAKLKYWNHIICLLNDFDWKGEGRMNLQHGMGREIRIHIRRLKKSAHRNRQSISK